MRMMEKKNVNDLIEHFSSLTLADAVNQNLQYFDEKKRHLLGRSLITEQFLEKEIRFIEEGLKRHLVDTYGIRDPFRLIKLSDEEMNDLVAHGYYGIIMGEDDVELGFNKDPYIIGVQQAFRKSVHLLIFTKEFVLGEDGADSEKLYWLEGIYYFIRGGNIAHYHEWLKRQKKYLSDHGKLFIEDDSAPTNIENDDKYTFNIKNASHQFTLLWALEVIQGLREKHSALSKGEHAAIIAAVMNRTSEEEIESVRKHISNVGTGKANDPLTRSSVRAVRAELQKFGIESSTLPDF